MDDVAFLQNPGFCAVTRLVGLGGNSTQHCYLLQLCLELLSLTHHRAQMAGHLY